MGDRICRETNPQNRYRPEKHYDFRVLQDNVYSIAKIELARADEVQDAQGVAFDLYTEITDRWKPPGNNNRN
jgi:hypothetical protein